MKVSFCVTVIVDDCSLILYKSFVFGWHEPDAFFTVFNHLVGIEIEISFSFHLTKITDAIVWRWSQFPAKWWLAYDHLYGWKRK